MGSTTARADGAQSDSDNLLRRDDFWHLSSGGAIAASRFWEFGSGGRAMTVLAWLRFFGSGTIVVRNDLSGTPDRDEGPPVDDPNCLRRCRMIRWTLRCAHCRHH